MEYSSGRQEGELPVAYREYDRFYNGASRDGDSRGEIYEADDTEQSVEHMIMMQLPWKTLTEEQHRIVKFCIHSLDQNGYLRSRRQRSQRLLKRRFLRWSTSFPG